MAQDTSERLCFTSELFDPTLALNTSKAIPTPPNSKVFSNLSKYVESLYQSASFKSLGWLPNVFLEESIGSLTAKSRSLTKPVTEIKPISEKKCYSKNRIFPKNCISLASEETEAGNLMDIKSTDLKLSGNDVISGSMQGQCIAAKHSIQDTNEVNSRRQENGYGMYHTHPLEQADAAKRSDKLQQLVRDVKKKELGKHMRFRPNVMERMESLKDGPMSILYNCMSKGLKLKVWTKRHAGFRGVCIGYLLAFDKHMNLAMIDVDEVYTLEVKTLSIEDQHQIKRRKKALKRSHNRLNRVKRIMEKISSNENDDTKGKDDTSVALIRSNASQEQLQYVTTKAQYLHNATNNKLADVSRKDGDIKIEMDPSLPEVLGTPTVFSENQKKETIDCISKISDDDDVKFAEMEEKTRDIDKKYQCGSENGDSGNPSTRLSLPEKDLKCICGFSNQRCDFYCCLQKKPRYRQVKPEFHVNSGATFTPDVKYLFEYCQFGNFLNFAQRQIKIKPEDLVRFSSSFKDVTHMKTDHDIKKIDRLLTREDQNISLLSSQSVKKSRDLCDIDRIVEYEGLSSVSMSTVAIPTYRKDFSLNDTMCMLVRSKEDGKQEMTDANGKRVIQNLGATQYSKDSSLHTSLLERKSADIASHQGLCSSCKQRQSFMVASCNESVGQDSLRYSSWNENSVDAINNSSFCDETDCFNGIESNDSEGTFNNRMNMSRSTDGLSLKGLHNVLKRFRRPGNRTLGAIGIDGELRKGDGISEVSKSCTDHELGPKPEVSCFFSNGNSLHEEDSTSMYEETICSSIYSRTPTLCQDNMAKNYVSGVSTKIECGSNFHHQGSDALSEKKFKKRKCSEISDIVSDNKNRQSFVSKRRHINQLFIRGSNIVLVAYEP